MDTQHLSVYIHPYKVVFGRRIKVYVMNTKTRATKTAALPRSLALLERSCFSNDILSIAASTLEFKSSMVRRKNTLPIIAIFSKVVAEEKRATGIRIKDNSNSCRNALSSLKANLNPDRLFLNAKKSLFKPLFCLCGLSLTT